MKKEELFNKIKESCEFLYHNHPEILRCIYRDKEITPLTALLSEHEARIFSDVLLRDNINCIYNLISIKDLDIPSEIRKSPHRAKALQNELIEKTREIIQNADKIFKEQALEIIDEDLSFDKVVTFLEEVKSNTVTKRNFLQVLLDSPDLLNEIVDLHQSKKAKLPSSSPELPNLEVKSLLKT